MGDQAQETDHVIIVVHGFSGTHDHHIGYPLSCNGLDPINLIQHF